MTKEMKIRLFNWAFCHIQREIRNVIKETLGVEARDVIFFVWREYHMVI